MQLLAPGAIGEECDPAPSLGGLCEEVGRQAAQLLEVDLSSAAGNAHFGGEVRRKPRELSVRRVTDGAPYGIISDDVSETIDVAGSYDAVAEEYGKRYRSELSGKPLDRALLGALAEMTPPGTLLDLGCGTGEVALHLHRLGRQVLGIDLSPRMIEVASRLCPGPDYRVGSMLNLDLEDASMGGAIAFYSIIHLGADDISIAFGEVRRVLVPDGLALIAFHTGDHILHLDEWLGRQVDLDFHFHEPSKIEQLLQRAGLEVESTLRRQPGRGEVQTERHYALARRPAVTLRPATAADRPYLRSLHHRCYRRWVEETWGWDAADQDRRFAEAWTTDGRSVVELRGEPVGVLTTSRRGDHLYVDDIEVHPDHQGRGIGSWLLRRLLRDADEVGIPTRLQVLRNNPARRLYERLGFTIDGSTDTHYQMQRPASL